jgi:hypothetical protein
VTRRPISSAEDFVPREALTMGIASILEAREIAILATGEHKAPIVRRAVEARTTSKSPRRSCNTTGNTTFYVDRAAGADLTRIATPWLLDEVEWTPALTVRGVVWLSTTVGRGILKLTQRDYAEHKMSSLVARYGTPGAVNGEVFNTLGAKIRGKSKLPRDKRIICFSPHPDDDVISMGGILRKLVENDNDMTVAYMTSGNIAVFDHDVRRYVDFLERLAAEGKLDSSTISALATKVYDFLRDKRAGDVDIQEIQDIKRVIRESEAVSGLEVMGPNAEQRAVPQPAVLPDRQGREGSDRSAGRRDRAGAARRDEPGHRVRRRRPVRSARHPSHVQGGDRRRACRIAGHGNRTRRSVALPRGVAGMAGDRRHVSRAHVAGRVAHQDPGDLQASVSERLRTLPRTG